MGTTVDNGRAANSPTKTKREWGTTGAANAHQDKEQPWMGEAIGATYCGRVFAFTPFRTLLGPPYRIRFFLD